MTQVVDMWDILLSKALHALDPSIGRFSESILYGKGAVPCLCHCSHLLFTGKIALRVSVTTNKPPKWRGHAATLPPRAGHA